MILLIYRSSLQVTFLLADRYEQFQRRQPSMFRCPEEEAIREWFDGLHKYLQEEGVEEILSDPSRIFNMDEIGVPLCPRTGKLLGVTKEKNNYFISSGKDKENITVLASYSADGKPIRPMIVYPYKRFPSKDVADSVPPGYVIGHSDSGYMTSKTFSRFIINGLQPDLVKNKTRLPVLLLFDGHRSHISMEVHDFCKNNGIILYLLYPNSTHILQPCDVGIFRPLKVQWKKVVAKHSQTSTVPIAKTNFAPLFNDAFVNACDPEVIKSAFRCCGLYPFDANAPNYSKCICTRRNAMMKRDLNSEIMKNSESAMDGNELPNSSSEIIDNFGSPQCNNESSSSSTSTRIDNNEISNNSMTVLQVLEQNIPTDILSIFKKAYQKNETPSKEILLFNAWKNLKNSLPNCEDSSVPGKNSSCVSNSDQFITDDIQDHEVVGDVFHGAVMLDINDIPIVTEVENGETLQSEIIEIIEEVGNLPINTNMEQCQIMNKNVLINEPPSITPSLEQVASPQESVTIDENAYTQSSTPVIEQNSLTHNNNCSLDFLNSVEISPSGLKHDISFISPSDQDFNSPMDLSTKKSEVHVQQFINQDNFIVEPSSKENIDAKINEPISTTNDSSYNLKDLWKQELHYPKIVKSNIKKIKTEKPKIYAITSEAYKKQEEEKLAKQAELEKLKELRKFEREVKKKIKQEEAEIKKQEKRKLQQQKKIQEELIKKEAESKLQMMLKKKAEALEICSFEDRISVPKKSKVLDDISNVQL